MKLIFLLLILVYFLSGCANAPDEKWIKSETEKFEYIIKNPPPLTEDESWLE